ncbi:hypothetical protein WDU94_010335 [Cyamophila willieti]
MSNKSMVKMYIDDRSGHLLDNLYRVIKTYTNNKKQSEKIIKSVIKIIIKSSLLVRNKQLSEQELATCETIKTKLQSLMMSFISFYEVDFSYDFSYLNKQLTQIRTLLVTLLSKHMQPKNVQKLESLFVFFNNKQFLDTIFNKKNESYRPYMTTIVTDLNVLLDGNP